MGTQPNKKLAKRSGAGPRSRKLTKKILDEVSKNNYSAAANDVSRVATKASGSNSIASAIIAGIVAYEKIKKSEGKISARRLAGEAITKIPKDVKKNLTSDGKDSIRAALQQALAAFNE